MENDFRVFVVDDEPVILELLRQMLAETCSVELFLTGSACLQRVAESRPDLFLIDVSMHEMDGYTLCRRLKEDWETRDIPVLFVSAHDDPETRIACYEAGGDDFIQKPFEQGELMAKLKVAQRMLVEKRSLHEQAGYAQRTAMSAMVSMGELGVVLQFLSKSFACDSLASLAEALLDATVQYGLQAAVQLRMGDESLSFSQNGHDVPLEASVLNHVRQAGRIFQFRSRCVFNYGQVTLMINDMPLDDADRCGRIRDNCALLAEGAEARRRSLESETLAHQRRIGIEAALPEVHGALEAVQENYRRNCYELTQMMVEFEEALLKSFVNLGLSEAQEDLLSDMAGDFMRRMVATQDEALQIVDQLKALEVRLEKLAGH